MGRSVAAHRMCVSVYVFRWYRGNQGQQGLRECVASAARGNTEPSKLVRRGDGAAARGRDAAGGGRAAAAAATPWQKTAAYVALAGGTTRTILTVQYWTASAQRTILERICRARRACLRVAQTRTRGVVTRAPCLLARTWPLGRRRRQDSVRFLLPAFGTAGWPWGCNSLALGLRRAAGGALGRWRRGCVVQRRQGLLAGGIVAPAASHAYLLEPQRVPPQQQRAPSPRSCFCACRNAKAAPLQCAQMC